MATAGHQERGTSPDDSSGVCGIPARRSGVIGARDVGVNAARVRQAGGPMVGEGPFLCAHPMTQRRPYGPPARPQGFVAAGAHTSGAQPGRDPSRVPAEQTADAVRQMLADGNLAGRSSSAT